MLLSVLASILALFLDGFAFPLYGAGYVNAALFFAFAYRLAELDGFRTVAGLELIRAAGKIRGEENKQVQHSNNRRQCHAPRAPGGGKKQVPSKNRPTPTFPKPRDRTPPLPASHCEPLVC